MPRLGFILLLTALACATSRTAEREEDDRLASNDRSMPSAADETPRRPVEPDDGERPRPRATSGNVGDAARAAEDAARQMKEAREDSERQCAALENRPVPTAEEEDMGLELALSAASAAPGGLYADGVDKAGLRALFEQRVATLPPGPKSDVAAWVQKLGQGLAGPKARVAFVVVEDPQARIESYLGGWVVVTSGMLATLGTEADVAAALAHQIAHIAARDTLNEYAKARFSACNIGVTGANLVLAGSMGIPGGQDFVKGSAFGKSQRLFSAEDIVQALKTPGADAAYVLHTLRQNLGMQRLTRPLETELKADDATFAMLSTGGYDASVMGRSASVEGVQSSTERNAALAKRQRRGRLPPLPPALKWPRP